MNALNTKALRSRAARIYDGWFASDFDPDINVSAIRSLDQLEDKREALSAGEFDAIEAALLNL